MENIDPKMVSNYYAENYVSSKLVNSQFMPTIQQTKTEAFLKPINAAPEHQFRSALLSVISAKEQTTTHDVLNLPPPEYLRNMPPPNVIATGSNIPQSSSSMSYKALNATKPAGNYEIYNRQAINRIPMSNLNLLTPPLTPPISFGSSFQWNAPNYSQIPSVKKVIQHNISGTPNNNDHQGSLFNISSPAHQLYKVLEECFDQFKMLQAERRKSEYEITKIFPQIKFSSSDNLPVTALPSSSRIDHLISETIREHSKILTMCMKMDFYSTGRALYENIQDALEKWIEAVRKVQSTRYDQLSESGNFSIPDNKLTADFKCLPIGEERKRKLHNIRNQIGPGKMTKESSITQSATEVQILALSKDINELNNATKLLRTALWKGICKLPSRLSPKPDNPTKDAEALL